jgi:hypothetical protein
MCLRYTRYCPMFLLFQNFTIPIHLVEEGQLVVIYPMPVCFKKILDIFYPIPERCCLHLSSPLSVDPPMKLASLANLSKRSVHSCVRIWITLAKSNDIALY